MTRHGTSPKTVTTRREETLPDGTWVVTIHVRGTWVRWYRWLWRWITRYKPPGVPGDDRTGDGSKERPYKTFARAMREVPLIIAPGEHYVVNLSELMESLPEKALEKDKP